MRRKCIQIKAFTRKDGSKVSSHERCFELDELTEEQKAKLDRLKDKLSEGLNLSESDIDDLDQISKDSDTLKTAIERNGGNPMELTIDGQPSKLHASLLEEVGGDKELADLMKAQVYSDEFKEWFGDWQNNTEIASKVVDENGEPLMVYHGTGNEFEEFDKTNIGENYTYSGDSYNSGFFFTLRRRSAVNYARLHATSNSKGNIHTNPDNKGFVISSFLSLKNPITRSTNSDFYRPVDRFDMGWGAEMLRERNIDDSIDSLIIYGSNRDDLFLAINPNQIKSIYNDGTFSTSDNNIYGSKIDKIRKGTEYEGMTVREIMSTPDGRKFLKEKGYFD